MIRTDGIGHAGFGHAGFVPLGPSLTACRRWSTLTNGRMVQTPGLGEFMWSCTELGESDETFRDVDLIYVPEPSTILLAFIGLLGIALYHRR